MPASVITDAGWLGAQLEGVGRLYRWDHRAGLGVLWWYSASWVLLGLPVEGYDPGLDSVTLFVQRDGRVVDARSAGFAPAGKLGARLEEALSAVISAVARESGASARALWAIATDSLANRVLLAGQSPSDADRLAAAVGPALPAPRYVTVSGRLVVRRASCCLVYEAPGQGKCLSCPRQTPEERIRRLSAGG